MGNELLKKLMLMEADKGSGGNAADQKDPPKTDDSTGDKDPNAGNGEGTPEKKFTQQELDEIVKARLEREKKKAEEAAEAATQAAEAKALKDQEKYKELAEKFEKDLVDERTKLTELSTLPEKLERTEGALKKLLETQRKGLPDHLIKLLDKMDPVDQLEYIAENKDVLFKTSDAPPKTPKGGGDNKPTEEQLKAAKESAARYTQNRF